MDHEIESLEAKQDCMENHSRRNSIKFMGVEETNEEQSWEDIEKAAQELFQEKLSFSNAIEIERAHGVNKKNKRRHLAQASNPED